MDFTADDADRGYLASIVNAKSTLNVIWTIFWQALIQVVHGAVLPNKSNRVRVALFTHLLHAHNLPLVIDAECAPLFDAQINHPSMAVKESRLVLAQPCLSYYFAMFVHGVGQAASL